MWSELGCRTFPGWFWGHTTSGGHEKLLHMVAITTRLIKHPKAITEITNAKHFAGSRVLEISIFVSLLVIQDYSSFAL
jgi:hypothetical protein